MSQVEAWMLDEVNEKLLTGKIYQSADYARQRMAKVRKELNQKRITVKAFCEFYKIDIWLFYPAPKMSKT